MTDAIQGLVSAAKNAKFSSISANLSDEDVSSVWDNVSTFVDKQMAQQKGVSIPGLGTFTFSQKKLDVGNNKYILMQRPVFLLSEKFAQIHGLHCTKHHVSGQIPVVQLNFAQLSFESAFDRDAVEACVKEVLGALQRSIAAKRNVEFTFAGIGRLQIRDCRVKMKFFKEFINNMDGSGRLVEALQDRPGTMDSVMTDRPMSVRPNTSNTLVLPRINANPALSLAPDAEPLTARPDMEAILEEGEDPADILKTVETMLEGTQALEDYVEQAPGVVSLEDKENVEDRRSPGGASNKGGSRMAIPLAKATGVSFHDELMPTGMQSPKGLRGKAALSTPSPMLLKRSLSPLNAPPTPRVPLSPDLRARSVDATLQRPILSGAKAPSPPAQERPHTANSCGHTNSGQELCYLCHQRARRNIPISFAEERKRREQEEDKLFQKYQHMKDQEALLQEQEHTMGRRHNHQKIASFNLGVSEAVRTKKNSKDTDFHPSYVFQKRPLTPPKFLKQDLYLNDLQEQVQIKESVEKRRKADEAFMERLEQVQLAEDLVAQREHYLKDKLDQQEQYKRALSAQIRVSDGQFQPCHPPIRMNKRLGPLTLPCPQLLIPFSESFTLKIQDGQDSKKVLRFKPQQMPDKVSDSAEPIFGKNDMNNEKMMERRRKAYNMYQDQLGTVEQRKREAILRRLHDQREEEDMLKRTKDELISDRADRYTRIFNNRKQLENDWFAAVDKKKQREDDEGEHARSAGMLVHEQCDKYKRCACCKRNLPNCGETNIWRETRYISGSRLMV